MSPQRKSKMDNKNINTKIFNISKNKITKNKDKGKRRGTIVMLLVLLRSIQFDLKEKIIGNP